MRDGVCNPVRNVHCFCGTGFATSSEMFPRPGKNMGKIYVRVLT
ncbi:Uncharacterized protein dnm_099720 [Desulfonema magnum]|uniref:Uncharacterized protein n=1 Tax=Desulfonema magnum TaxID=45655 RepID=A0A975C103_9BACT|nr:Uncharacterized protein dnm_099720 [Desulfonema magnum]